MDRKKLVKEISKLAKRANTRLTALYDKGLSNTSRSYKYIKDKAYDEDYITKNNRGVFKFDTKLRNKSYNELQSEYFAIQRFLGNKTSTLSGIKEAYQKSYESYKEQAKGKAKNISFNDYIELHDNYYLEQYKVMYGSKELENLVNEHSKDYKEIAKKVIQFKEKNELEFVDLKQRDILIKEVNPYEDKSS